MIYIHIPFCHSKCCYCDFSSTPNSASSMDTYVDALLKELDLRAEELTGKPKTIYIGGGTPSILSRNTLSHLFNGLRNRLDYDSLEEFTIEVNPEDVTDDLLSFYADNGVGRVSMGIQSFDDGILKTINRRHSSADALNAIELIRNHKFNFSCDLIYGLPGQNSDIWADSLKQLLSFNPNHLSAYLLSYEHGTKLYAMLKRGMISEADENLIESMYAELCRQTANAGYDHYEISNFGKPGFHAIHNSRYWKGDRYIGLGASAYSFNGRDRLFNPADLKSYLSAITSEKTAYIIEEEDESDRYNDLIVTSLRTSEGISPDDVPELFHDHFDKCLKPLLANGLLIAKTDGNIAIPEDKWLLADSVMRSLIFV